MSHDYIMQAIIHSYWYRTTKYVGIYRIINLNTQLMTVVYIGIRVSGWNFLCEQNDNRKVQQSFLIKFARPDIVLNIFYFFLNTEIVTHQSDSIGYNQEYILGIYS